MADLVVELYGVRLGVLSGPWRTFDFVFDPGAVAHFGIDSPVLSVSVPLAVVAPRARKQRRQNFFIELLPEGRMLTRLAEEASVPPQDVIGLLRRHGRDIAGALQIWDPAIPGEPRTPTTEPLTPYEVADLLTHVSEQPLGNKPVGGKTSLAGVQDKIVLVRTPDGWARALDGFPSTHILKPELADQPSVIHDEEYGWRLAAALGLAPYAAWIERFDDISALVIERYDRAPEATTGRIHQEDFNQALSASGNQKYQRLGGSVSLARVAGVLVRLGDRDGLARLLRLTTLSVAVGNLDQHAKNLSLLHRPDGSITLAPAYDVVPQAHHPGDGELAMAVDGEYRHQAVTRDHLMAEGRSWGLAGAGEIVDETLSTIAETLRSETPHPAAHPELVDDITRFTTELRAGRPAGRI